MIRTDNLGMIYGTVQALQGVNFEIKQGEVIGLLGPNGAGKSTTLKILTSYIYPTTGTAYIANYDVCKSPLPIRKMVGYLPEQLPLYMDMEVAEYLSFVGKARGLKGRELMLRLDWVKNNCGLKTMYHKLIRELSKGYRQRTSLAQALIHDPQIVILDEPTSGLDPHQIMEIRRLIRELAQHKTVIFSTHILQEVQAITNRVIVLNQGKIVADGVLDDLQNKSDYQQYEIVLKKNIPEVEVITALKSITNGELIAVEPHANEEVSYVIKNSDKQDLRISLQRIMQEKQLSFLEVKKRPFTLEEIFLRLTEQATK